MGTGVKEWKNVAKTVASNPRLTRGFNPVHPYIFFAHLEIICFNTVPSVIPLFVHFFTHNFLSKFLKINIILNLRNLFRVNMIEYAWIILIWDIFYIYFPLVITKSVKYYFSDKKIRRNLLKPTKNDQFYEEPTITVIRLRQKNQIQL